MKLIDLKGKRFGRLTVIERADTLGKEPKWLCKCDCGNTSVVIGAELRKGNTSSCGCYAREVARETALKNMAGKNRTHGMAGTRLYKIWASMYRRCYNTKDTRYKDYGNRGITVSDEWLHNFPAFYKWAMDNGYNDSLTIDRIDVKGNYEPSNCRWADMKTQSNNRTNNHLVDYKGTLKTVAQLSEEFNIPYKRLWKRLKSGWAIEKALTTPKK